MSHAISTALRFLQGSNSLVCVPCGAVVGQNHTAKIALHCIVAHLVQEPTQGRLGSERSVNAVRCLPGVSRSALSFIFLPCVMIVHIAFTALLPGGSVCPVWSERPTSLNERSAMASCSVDTTVAASEAL
jgi:hypothetical protein